MAFIQVDKKWFGAKAYISPKTGEVMPLSADKKNMYLVLRDRNRYFRKEGKLHFESQETIASLCNVDRRTVGRYFKELMEEGILFGRKQGRRWYYDEVKEMTLVGWDEKHPFFKDEGRGGKEILSIEENLSYKEYLYEDMDAPNW